MIMATVIYIKHRIDMKPEARIEHDCWILSQLFDGYGGYVYEVANRWSNAVLYCFAFRGDRIPDDDSLFEGVMNLRDGVEWLKKR